MKILWLGLEHSLGIEGTHDVLILNKENFDMERVRLFAPDIVIEREFNDAVSIYDQEVRDIKEKFPSCKTAVWLIDTHVAYDRHKEYVRNFDYVFMAISAFANDFHQYHRNVFWLPTCFPVARLQKIETVKTYMIGFVGRRTEEMVLRNQLLNKVEQAYGSGECHFETNYDDPYGRMRQCMIMLNQSFLADMNFRVFEALACGNILVTNSVPDLFKIKTLSERMFIFNDHTEALNIIGQILETKVGLKAVKEIRKNRQFIQQHHTLKNRAQSMLEMMSTNLQVEF